jgi:two-component system chemotaxis response regulator CheY
MGYNLSKLRVLVVDDSKNMRMLVRTVLTAIGVQTVREAGDGNSAMTELRSNPIDIAIIDWVMEPMDGLDFVRQVRTAEDSPNQFLPIIMMTGHTERHRIFKARDAGVTEFLAKPITAKTLLLRLTNIIEHPRPFVRAKGYFGPDRRRRSEDYTGPERRGQKTADIAASSSSSPAGAAEAETKPVQA